VESVRHVQIEGTRSGIGTAAGAVVGGIGGSNIGGGKGSSVGTVLGAVAGGVVGSAIEQGTTRRPAWKSLSNWIAAGCSPSPRKLTKNSASASA